MKDWRTLIEQSDSHAQYPQNPQNPEGRSNSEDIEDIGDKVSRSEEPSSAARFSPGQQVFITDNENRVRAGVIQFADWIDEPMTARGWWYCIIDVYGLLSETHESRIRDARLKRKEPI